jgi:hypothetical protein
MAKIDPVAHPVSGVSDSPETPYARAHERIREKGITARSGTSDTATDLFEQIFAPADEVAAGLGLLAQSAPLWGTRLESTELVAALRGFEERWGAVARAAGWSPVELWGLDPIAPRARLSRTGGAFLACLHNHRAVQVDPDAIRLVTRTSARLSVYRPEPGGVLAWELCASESRRQS